MRGDASPGHGVGPTGILRVHQKVHAHLPAKGHPSDRVIRAVPYNEDISWHLGAADRIYSIAVNGSGGNGKRCEGLPSRLSGRVLRTVLGAGAGVKRQQGKPIGPAGEVSCTGG